MKKIFNYLIAGAAVLTLATACCEDSLETSPTTAVSGTTMTQSSDAAMIALNGIYRSMYTSGWSTTGNTHQCFGISAYTLCADVMGDDHIMAAQGNGWFWFDARYNVKARYTSGAWRSYDLWYAFYQWISNANYLIAMDEEGLSDVDKMYVLGQAYAVRAYSYYMLSQYFARTYKGHEGEPCVPIYTEPSKAGTQGHPRATVAEVYEQAKNDIVKAVDYLNKSVNNSLDEDKSYITYPVALGIQARIALTMEDWGTAARAAEAVINLNKYTIQPVAAAAFKKNTSNFINNVGAGNVMWGAGIIADQSGIYASLYSHMDHDADMYGGYDAAPKRINVDTYNLMGAADTRRCWWDPNNETVPYVQEKMHFSDINTYLGDYVWMRIEEMYLTAAEAECMQGNEDAARNYLNTLVKTRDANYNCTATGTAMGKLTSDRTGSLREAIIDQRRIELWGEFGRLYDIKRLKQGFLRTVAQGWPNDPNILLTNRPSDDPENYMWVLTIPQAEFDGNASLDPTKDQNPTGDK
ncbi:MAG: RagB/SusD family nutrient uptake outer membrane protein [Prevotella sp.]|nr:RagB/SusD family nutrient uptake outer membrane protein [Prevotella sp.]